MGNFYDSPIYMQDLHTAIKQVSGIEKLSGKNLLVTGATGLIGSFIVDMLCAWNEGQKNASSRINIYATSRSTGRLESRFDGCPARDSLHFIEQDFADPIAFDCPADYIIHAAGNSDPASFNRDPVGTIAENILGTRELLDYAKQRDCKRFLFMSTGEVYGEMPPEAEAFLETDSGYVDPVNPRSCYPASKRAAETLCAAYRVQYGVNIVIARSCHVYGANVTARDSHATAQFIRNAMRGEDIVLKSAGNQLRSYCYVADTASAVLTILLRGRSGEAYNIANSASRLTVADFADLAAKTCGVKVVRETDDENGKNGKKVNMQSPISKAVLDSSKLESLGWRGSFDAETGVRHVVGI